MSVKSDLDRLFADMVEFKDEFLNPKVLEFFLRKAHFSDVLGFEMQFRELKATTPLKRSNSRQRLQRGSITSSLGGGRGFYFSDENMISSTPELETSQHDSKNTSKPATDSKKWADEHSGNAIIRSHEIKPAGMLLNLEKKPLECYFEGLKGKPSRRRKIRQPKKKCLNFWHSEGSSAPQNEGWISTLSGAPPKEREWSEVEDRLLGSMIHMKMKVSEKIKEHIQEKISMKQRLAEESYLEQQENLAETWLGIMKRRSQLRNIEWEDTLSCPRPTFGAALSKRHTRVQISILSKKFWKDEKEEPPLQKKEEPSVVDNLDEVFGAQLVFIDDED